MGARRDRGVRARALLVVVAFLVLSGGCGSSTGPGASPSPATEVPPSTDPPGTFSAREELPSCGALELGQGEVVPQSAWSCLDHAGQTGAELVVSAPTTEGDPIVTYYRVGPDIDRLELFVDTSADAFAGVDEPAWRHQVCPGTSTAQEPVGCRESGA